MGLRVRFAVRLRLMCGASRLAIVIYVRQKEDKGREEQIESNCGRDGRDRSREAMAQSYERICRNDKKMSQGISLGTV